MNRAPLAPGDILADKYQLIAPLGAGGMGEVWRAEHLILKAHVAIKLILDSAMLNQEVANRFVREAQAAAALRSPYVVSILDYGVDPRCNIPFMVMELLEGESLAARLKRQQRLAPQELARVISHVSRAVGKAHEAGIVHRDLKPENIFLTYADDEVIAKVLDFGIAKFQQPLGEVDASTRTGALVGTPYYMSPEQAEGRGKVDSRSDIWALGAIAYECLTGQRPFDSDALGELLVMIMVRPIPVPSQVAQVPPGFDEWFARAVCRLPQGRFATTRELSDALNQVCGVAPGGTFRSPLPDRTTVDQPGAAPYGSSDVSQPMARTAEPLAKSVSAERRGPSPLIVGGLAAGLLLVAGLGISGVFVIRHLAQKREPPPVASEVAPPVVAAPPASTAATPTPPPAESSDAPAPSADTSADPTAEKAPEATKTTAPTKTPTKAPTKTPEKSTTDPKKTGAKSPSSPDDML